MNPFLGDASSRFLEWRKLRDDIATLDLQEQLKQIAKWWGQCPVTNWVIDYESSKNWPKAWELMQDNHYCNTAIAYLMSMTLILLQDDIPNYTIELVYINTEEDQWMCLLIDGKWLLNYSHGEIYPYPHDNSEFTVKYRYTWNGQEFI